MGKNVNELITVIIPVYNVEKYLNKCMESVVNQTYKSLEILLIDDGAKDSSGFMCDSWAERDSRIKVIHKENGGLSSARNCGLDQAHGNYIMFVDSDDFMSEDIVSILYEDIKRTKADIAICDAMHIFEDYKVVFDTGKETRTYTSIEAIQEMWYQKSFLPSAWGKLYKLELFQNIRFTENRLYEDIDIMHELFWKAETIIYRNDKLYGYVHRDESITTQKFSERDLDIFIISDKMLEFADKVDPKLLPAAESYATVAALRILLNAPEEKFQGAMHKAENIIKKYGKKTMKNRNIRTKQKYALIMFFYCRPLLKKVYKHINRWK